MKNKRDFIADKVQVGERATYCAGTDRYPCIVVEVSESGKNIVLQRMNYGVRTGSEFDGSAEYWYAENPNGLEFKASLRKDGFFRMVGCQDYGTVIIGHARAYRDPHF